MTDNPLLRGLSKCAIAHAEDFEAWYRDEYDARYGVRFGCVVLWSDARVYAQVMTNSEPTPPEP